MTKARIREIRNSQGRTHNGEATAMIDELLAEVERLQSFTRRGASPEPELPHKAKGKAPDPRINEFTEGWVAAYKAWHGEPYPHGGAKDAQAVKRLLILAQIDDLLDTAYAAWQHPDKFNCARSVTIAGFCASYAGVRLELKTIASNGKPQRQEPPSVTL